VPTQNLAFGGGATDTIIHPIILMAMIVAIVLIFVLSRKNAIIPFLAIIFLVPAGQTLVAGGVHLYAYRIVFLVGLIRMAMSRSGEKPDGLNSLDKCFTLCAIVSALATVLRYSFEWGAVVNQLGILLDVFGGYFLLRFLIRDDEDVQRAVKTLAWIAAIVAVCAINEKLFRRNPFGYFGSLPIVSEVRDGSIRPEGPFAQPILCGVFGATLFPLFFWLRKSGKSRILALTGLISSTIIVLASASSTPLMGYVGGIIAMCFWPFRKKMRTIRWGIAIGLITLHLIMKAPVWFLLTHIDLIGASSGYQRAELIDQCVKHFWDWWLIGTNDTAKWGWDMWDLANQYVAECETGGLATFILFIAMISICFGWIGKARKSIEGDEKKEWYLWLLGSALFSHLVGYLGISYFDQMRFSWFALLAVISAATTAILQAKVVPEQENSRLSGVPRPMSPAPALSGPALARREKSPSERTFA
jgi:hypothetical protein